MTGANGTGMAFLDGFQGGFNAGNAVVNAYRTAQDNARLRRDQQDYENMLRNGVQPNNGYTQPNNGYTVQMGEIPQMQNVVMAQPKYTVSFGDLLGGNEQSPFGESANGEGQRIAD